MTARVAVHGAALALAALVVARSGAITAAHAAVGRTRPVTVRNTARPRSDQGGIAGRYALRSVNGQPLPAPIMVEELHHNTHVTAGVLLLNADNTYICETRLESSYLGLVQPQSDTLRGTWDSIGGSFVTLFVTVNETDTLPTTGTQIAWTHATKRSAGRNRYTYSK